jgi:O-Antigen ligase
VGMVGLGAALLLSTSTTALAALLLYLGGVCTLALGRALAPASRRLWPLLAAVLALAGLALLAGLVLRPDLLSKLTRFADVVVGSKLDSGSGTERMAWMAQGLRNLRDTWGLGVGLGSNRSSSFLVVLLSNLGVLGTLLYAAFVVAVLRTPRPPGAPTGDEDRLRTAFRHAFLAALCPALVSGTVFERGPAFYLYAAAASVVWCGAVACRPVVRPRPALNLARA